jgi:hypothetical protein
MALRQHHGSHHDYNAQPCLEHLAGAILTCKLYGDAKGIKPTTSGFTLDAIKAQVVGCLGYDLEDQVQDSFLLPSDMERPTKITTSDFGMSSTLYYLSHWITLSFIRLERVYS